MPDILGQGGDRGPRPWPRRVAAVAVLLLAAVLIVVHLPRHGPGGSRPRPAASTASPAPSTASPAPPAPGELAPGLADESSGLIGQTLPWDDSLRLPVTGQQPLWLWPATGRTKPIGGLPRDRYGYQFTRVAGGWAVQALSGTPAGCGDCSGPPLPVYFLGNQAQSVTQVGLANQVAPAATAGAVWLTSYPPDAALSTAAGLARQVSVAGVALGSQVRLPPGYVIDQATDRGLLLAPAAQRSGSTAYQLWNPATGRAERRFGAVVAASPGEVAWAAGCAPVCRVQVLNLVTGRQTVVRLPEAGSPANAAFSPDGAFLAIEVSLYNNGDFGALAAQLDVVSVATGRLAVVPRTFVSSDAMAGFGWPAASDTLIAELNFMTRVQVASWRPGATRLAVAVVAPGPNSTSLIVG
jgi:hypothetical protein